MVGFYPKFCLEFTILYDISLIVQVFYLRVIMEKAARIQWWVISILCLGLMIAGVTHTYGQSLENSLGLTPIASNDSMTRAYMTVENFERGNWFADERDRIVSLEPFKSHWTRIVELPSYLFLTVASLFLNPVQAIEYFSIFFPPLMWGGVLGMLFWSLRPLKDDWIAPFLMFTMIVQFQFWSNFWVGRLDMPTYQLSFFAMMISVLVRFFLEGKYSWQYAALGAVGFVGALWTTPESTVMLVAILAVFGVPWFFGKAEYADYNRLNFRFIVGFLLIALLCERGIDFYAPEIVHLRHENNRELTDQLVSIYPWDRFSFLHAMPMFLIWLFWEAVCGVKKFSWGNSILVKIILLFAFASSAFFILLQMVPGLLSWNLNNELSRSSTVYYMIRSGKIAEGASIFVTEAVGEGYDFNKKGTDLTAFLAGLHYLTTYLIGLCFMVALTVKQRKYWPLLLGYILVLLGYWGIYTGMRFELVIPIKGMMFLQTVAIIPVALVFFLLAKKLQNIFQSNLKYSLSFLISLMTFGAIMIAALFYTPSKKGGDNSVGIAFRNEISEIYKNLSEQTLLPLEPAKGKDYCAGYDLAKNINLYLKEDSSQLILAYPDVGAKLLHLTNHKVAAIPSHRFQPYLDIGRWAMVQEDPNAAKRILQEAGFNALQICLEENARGLFPVGDGSDAFSAQLMRGDIPNWIKPVRITSDYALFIPEWAEVN